jgi:hypothetical protein
MSNKITLNPELKSIWDRAEAIMGEQFDHGDGSHEVKKAAIAANLISLSKAPRLGDMWHKLDKKAQDKMLKQLAHPEAVEEVEDADQIVDAVWDKMTPDQKETYLKWHPKSIFHEVHKTAQKFNARDNPGDPKDPLNADNKKTEDKKKDDGDAADEAGDKAAEDGDESEDKKSGGGDGPNDGDDTDKDDDGDKKEKKPKKPKTGDDWWDSLTPELQAEYLQKHPNSRKAKKHKGLVNNLVAASMDKIHEHTFKMGLEFRHGMEGLRAFKSGENMTDEQKEGLKNTAKVVGGILVGALVATALFTPLGPYAMDLGSHYMDKFMARDTSESKDISESGVNLHKHSKKSKRELDEQDKEDLNNLVMDMKNWLVKQDPVKLAKELKAKAEKE